jgi:hypothetical protein
MLHCKKIQKNDFPKNDFLLKTLAFFEGLEYTYCVRVSVGKLDLIFIIRVFTINYGKRLESHKISRESGIFIYEGSVQLIRGVNVRTFR